VTSVTLREQVVRGGAYLGLRQVIGLAVSLVGVFVLMRVLGPREYGLYAAALGFYMTLQLISQLGIGVFLIRREHELEAAALHQAATLSVALGLAGFTLGVLSLPLVTQWSRLPDAGLPALALYAALPLVALAQVPIAVLDRRLDYKRIAVIELTGQVTFFAVSVAYALISPSVWAPVIAWWIQQIILLVGASASASYLPRFRWSAAEAREMIAYGGSFSASVWLYQLRRALNPLIVGRYLGAEAVAVVALASQLVVQLSFVVVSTWRLSTAALARVQSDPGSLLRAINEGMRLQVPAVAPFLLLFAWLGPWIMGLLLGPEWLEVPVIFPYLAAAFLFNAIFTMQSSALYVLRENVRVATTHLLQLALLGGVALFLVPRFGLVGWGIAELTTVLAFIHMNASTSRAIGKPRYGATLVVAAAWAAAMFGGRLGPLSLVLIFAVLILVQPWRELRGALAALRPLRSGT
jgi:O-antigen/teichoic acid export membrane protein